MPALTMLSNLFTPSACTYIDEGEVPIKLHAKDLGVHMSYSKRVHKATFKKRIKAARVKLDKVRRAPIPHKFRATMAQTAGIAKATMAFVPTASPRVNFTLSEPPLRQPSEIRGLAPTPGLPSTPKTLGLTQWKDVIHPRLP